MCSNRTPREYQVGDVVWAKVKGYTWWPAKVSQVFKHEDERKTRLLVHFLGHNTHATLKLDKIADYSENYSAHSQSKNKGLHEAIAIANKISKPPATSINRN